VAAATKRRRQPVAATALETCGGIGAAFGLLITAAHQQRHPTQAPVCSASALRTGQCLSQTLSHDITPYVKGGLLGLGIGAITGLIGVLLFVYLRREWTVRRFRAAIPATAPSPSSAAGDASRLLRSIPERVRHEVWRRDEARCVDCNSRQRLEFDHIIPISKGGSNTARNIELRCETCNRRKGDKT
jgi:hypothetical protein